MSVLISAERVDITTLSVDAVVNAANRALSSGGGVDGAINRVAGPQLVKASQKFAPLPTGQSVLTEGFDLPAKYVIHTVGPVWSGGMRQEHNLLASCYRTALRVADQHELTSLAFPAISTGAYGFPRKAAAKVAVQTVRKHLQSETSLTHIIFACFDDKTVSAYQHELNADPR